ncbi:SacI homology domain-containing protein [Coniochaeta sp. 2T2.1]|nr:SacI homology domain-containing protein [Coniochaeta sp. 2T2.1]
MPGLARKIIICATVDGLILHPINSKKDQRPAPPLKLKYGDASVSTISRDALLDASKANSSFEAFGIVGLITVSRFCYLISITRRQQVAQIRGSPIYVITEVALTPCNSYQDASVAVAGTADALRRQHEAGDGDDGDSSDNDELSVSPPVEPADLDPASEDEERPKAVHRRSNSSIAEDVISRKGSYGRFAQRWFSRTGWALDQKRNMGLTTADKEEQEDEPQNTTEGQKGEVESAAEAVQPLPENSKDAAGTGAGDAEDTSKGAVQAAKVAAAEDPNIPAAGGLLPKLLRTTQILFGSSRSFFFSYDYDITRSALNTTSAPLIPLHEHADRQFFWNRNIIRPFLDAGADAVALPLMQGYVGQTSFVVDSQPPQTDDGSAKDSVELSSIPADIDRKDEPTETERNPTPDQGQLRPTQKQFDITIISRRSIKRAGMRFHRRGVDEEGNVANSVESEQILSPSVWDPTAKVYSFVQIRGSIPLFFTQSPYSLKPAPVIRHSPEKNFAAMKKHFDGLEQRYNKLQIVNLVEKHGTEATVGDAYEKNVARLNEARGSGDEAGKGVAGKIHFEWFDFHDACRGMKFENVALLLQTLGQQLESFGSTTIVSEDVTTKQTGVLRTNCMDCLDRTNVCQSSFAKYVLDHQLKEQGFDMSAQGDQVMSWFNILWADNGDAISKQYASTAAMKGDYTRTKKRNYRGALMDAGLGLSRFYNGMVNDFFLQATIDFLLGNVTSMVFEEFESTMMTKDPAVSMSKMREQAIELSQKRVIEDENEEFIGGWTMLTPRTPDTIKAQTFEEAVVLLTDAALYLCRFDWNLDKVSSFDRVDLAHVQGIRFGTYVTSTFSAAQTDEEKNVGLVVEYKPGHNDITRINTRTLSTLSSLSKTKSKSTTSSEGEQTPTTTTGGLVGNLLGRRTAPVEEPARKIVLKALYTTTSLADPALKDPGGGIREGEPVRKLTELQQVVTVASEIERLAIKKQPGRFEGKSESYRSLVEKADIVSLAEARRSTGLFETIGHSIKKMVWA